MNYVECNMINQVHILPLGKRRLLGFCPREEMADPHKLRKFCTWEGLTWDIFAHDESFYYRAWVPWRKTWRMQQDQCTIRSTGIYLLTEHTAMFQRMHGLLCTPPNEVLSEDVFDWLLTWWHTPFLITAPILCHCMHDEDASISYFVNNRYHPQKIPLDGETDATHQLITGQAYTVCNGFTLFLAMLRTQSLPLAPCEEALRRLLPTNHGPELLMDVNMPWAHLYILHTSPHVADHPWIYARMGNNPAPARICNMLRLEDDSFVPQFGAGNIGSVTSLVSSILPYRPFEMQWPLIPSNVQDEDTFAPDIASFILGVVRTRASFRWWCQHARNHIPLRSALFFDRPEHALEAWLAPLLHFYVHAREHQPALKHNRLRRMWLDIIAALDPNGTRTMHQIRNWIVRDTVLHHLANRGYLFLMSMTDMPFAFLKDVFEMHKKNIHLWKDTRAIVYTAVPAILLSIYPAARLRDDGGVHVIQTLFHLFGQAPTTTAYGAFYRSYIQRRITSRLLGIQKGFGTQEGCDPTFDPRDGRLPLVGFLTLEYLRDHKEALVF